MPTCRGSAQKNGHSTTMRLANISVRASTGGSLARSGLGRAARKLDVDLIVWMAKEGTVRSLTDLLGRSMGNNREDASHQFTIYPEGHAFETMADMNRGPHASLDAALAEIERHTRGVCRRSTGEDKH